MGHKSSHTDDIYMWITADAQYSTSQIPEEQNIWFFFLNKHSFVLYSILSDPDIPALTPVITSSLKDTVSKVLMWKLNTRPSLSKHSKSV